MKKVFAVAAAVGVLLFAYLWLHDFVEKPKVDPNSQQLIVIGTENYPPLIFRKGDEVDGLSVRPLKLLNPAKYQVTWTQEYPLPVLFKFLANGDVDVVTSVTETEERKKFALFTKPYFIVGTKMFHLKSRTNTDIKTICVGEAFAIESWIRTQFPDRKIVTDTTDAKCVTRVLTGDADAAAMDEISALLAVPHPVAHKFNSERLGFTYALAYAVSKKKPWLVDVLNSKIDKAESTSK